MNASEWMPVVFMGLMGVAMLTYVVLDGYDLGVGMLMHRAGRDERDLMIASIGPFWDANETWLVLGVGILLIAFPKAHGVVLTALYLPVALMLLGLTLRGVAFDFRVKARDQHQPLWNRAFIAGSTITAVAQGWMLGRYITGFAEGALTQVFAALIALALPAAYVLMGACWLVMKTEGPLQAKAVHWARLAWAPVVVGMGLISIATPLVSQTVRERWFRMPDFIALLPIPLITLVALVTALVVLRSRGATGRLAWLPFAAIVGVFLMGGIGLAFSLFPYVVMDRMTIWQAASAPKSLAFILVGCAITVPAIAGYTVFSYRVFRGKVRALSYG
ncbi:cytochrome d ubiquinol oxidase subunit II [Ideonella sp.]|uniref:cytochrome d ubiquinol oxidase subunit II n=1 Tax=Ideonella sp. TaxID=1929293 RepID=UPI002B46C630|nr:cytochrome d ubiquinol oxidase subunit II [Ideonella sp.]HJV69275.1 cytochrome d ubiquinol oxidase subunit II [Ideonella sp.]